MSSFTAKPGDVWSMSPALNEDDGLSARFSKEGGHHQKRRGTCGAALSSFEVPVCIVEVDKRIFLAPYSQ